MTCMMRNPKPFWAGSDVWWWAHVYGPCWWFVLAGFISVLSRCALQAEFAPCCSPLSLGMLFSRIWRHLGSHWSCLHCLQPPSWPPDLWGISCSWELGLYLLHLLSRSSWNLLRSSVLTPQKLESLNLSWVGKSVRSPLCADVLAQISALGSSWPWSDATPASGPEFSPGGVLVSVKPRPLSHLG